MATYQFYKRGAALPHHNPGYAPFRQNIDIPDIILNDGLANTSDVATSLASTGFAAADVLRVFDVPVGFVLTQVGAWVTTVEGGACTADIGNASATQTHRLAAAATGYMGTFDLNSATAQITLIADTHIGGSTYMGVVFITDGTIDITFNTAATAAAIFDTWAEGFMAWD